MLKCVTIHSLLGCDSNGFCHYKSPSLRKDRFAILLCRICKQILRGPSRMGPLRWAKPISGHKLWPVIAQQVRDSAVNSNSSVTHLKFVNNSALNMVYYGLRVLSTLILR